MLISILLIICCSSIVTSTSVENWYWRDYDGLIPNDALATGLDERGLNTYLAQVIVPNKNSIEVSPFVVVPAIVRIGESFAVGPYHGTVRSNINVKILCTTFAERYVWLSLNEPVPVGCRYVIGGMEVLTTKSIRLSYIGRTNINKEIVTGKIIGSQAEARLKYPYNGTELTTNDYRALFYCYD